MRATAIAAIAAAALLSGRAPTSSSSFLVLEYGTSINEGSHCTCVLFHTCILEGCLVRVGLESVALLPTHQEV